MTNVQMKHPPLIPNVFFSLYPMEASPFHPFLLLFPPYQMDTNCPHSAGTTFTSCRKICAKGSNTFSIIVQILLLSNLVNLSPLQKKTLANSPPFYSYNSSCPSSPSLSLSPFFCSPVWMEEEEKPLKLPRSDISPTHRHRRPPSSVERRRRRDSNPSIILV